jgi:O-acetyl-ADP-ribose deacetylase (regulator of RNase III)
MHLFQQSSLVKAALISAVRHENIKANPAARVLNQSTDVLRDTLGDLLISSNRKWKEETLQLIDSVWKEESNQRSYISVGSMESFASVKGTKLTLWRGDITRLQGDKLAIVNAANDQGLGCFEPDHKCIDNIIHRRAGPRLRVECEEVMQKRGYPLSAGTEPIVTEAYHLPSDYVIHVTGPQIGRKDRVSDIDEQQLSRAYDLSLSAAINAGATSVAFPCISTGLFGFPSDHAAELALSTTQKWLERHPNVFERVVFNVFTNKDETIYEELILSKFGDINMEIDLVP